MSDDERTMLSDWLERQAGGLEYDALTVFTAQSECEAVAMSFSGEHHKTGEREYYLHNDEWPPKEFVELCRQVAEFEIFAPPEDKIKTVALGEGDRVSVTVATDRTARQPANRIVDLVERLDRHRGGDSEFVVIAVPPGSTSDVAYKVSTALDIKKEKE